MPATPAKPAEQEAEEVLASVLASSKSPLATLGSLQQAETALAGTTESVNALQRCGVPSNDTILSN